MDFNNLFTPEAIAAYVTFAIGVVVTIIGFFISRWLSRTRPSKVNVLKEDESSLIEINPQVRSEISVTYKGKPANSLFLTSFSIWNGGQEIIDNAEFTMSFQDTDVIEVAVDDPIPDRKQSIKKEVSSNSLKLFIPYLNPEKAYRDKIKIQVFALKPINVSAINGGGRGWTIESIDQVQLFSDISNEIANVVNAKTISSPTELTVSFAKAYFRLLPTIAKFILGRWF